ncbi:MAG: hypothetical protein N3A02_07765, partial [Rectinema sp.]|nr:hypothetical protein [Rectinema sp.]
HATPGTATFIAQYGIPETVVHWPLKKAEPNIMTMLRRREFDLVINIPKNNLRRELTNDYVIRRMAVDLNIPLFTNIKTARQYIESLAHVRRSGLEIKAWQEYQ